MYEHLLVPVEDSDLSNRAIEASIGLAKLLGARITGFTVERPLPPMVLDQVIMGYDPDTITTHQMQCEGHAREVLQRFGERAREAGVPFEGQFSVTDNVQEAIVEASQRHACDLIVMATHGRHGLDALISGSLTTSVLSHSQVALLVVH